MLQPHKDQEYKTYSFQLASPHLTMVLVGNKCDLSNRRSVGSEEGERFAMEHGMIFMEASAKTAQNVEEVIVYTPM